MTDKKKQAVNDVLENKERYSKHYDEDSFFQKIFNYGKKAGAKVVFASLLLFYALKSERMPLKEKTMVLAALGYFIFPFDLIPDFIPIAGYGDDFAVLYATVRMMTNYIDEDVVENAENKLSEWFPDVDESELQSVLNLFS